MGNVPLLGEIALFPFNFAPRGWAPCNGQLIPASQNQGLFMLLGSTFGGDSTNFALPDFNNRVALGASTAFPRGQQGGEETHALTEAEMPTHTHTVACTSTEGSASTPTGYAHAASKNGVDKCYSIATPNSTMAPGALIPVGTSQPHENRQPSLGLGYHICLQGIYPVA